MKLEVLFAIFFVPYKLAHPNAYMFVCKHSSIYVGDFRLWLRYNNANHAYSSVFGFLILPFSKERGENLKTLLHMQIGFLISIFPYSYTK